MLRYPVQVHDEIEVRLLVAHFPPHRILALRARVATRRLGCRVAGHAREILIDQAAQLRGVEVADNDERRVVRGVVGIEKGLDVRNLRRIEIGHRPDDGVGVREAARAVERPRQAIGERSRIGLIVDAQAALFFHRLPLVIEVVFRDGERAHAVGLEPQRQVQPVRRDRLEVIGAILGGAAVVGAPRALHQLPVLRFLHVRRPFEHHVLEEVREARAAGALVARAHLVPHIDRHDGGRVILGVDDVESVGERELLEGDLACLS